MGVIVKICGLSTEESVDAALAAGADMVGLNFFPPSPRFISVERAASLAARARGKAEIVTVTVDMEDPGLAGIVAAVRPDWLQFHGRESPARVAEAKERFGIRVMKAIGVRERADLAAANAYRRVADRLLLDAKPPKGAVLPGGNGAPFDWRILENFDPGMTWLLAGGIDASNVAEALAVSRAPGIDASSGVETAPGRKDPALIRSLIAAARANVRRPERAAS
jgi:phosphoribosylanthranilate isomerase